MRKREQNSPRWLNKNWTTGQPRTQENPRRWSICSISGRGISKVAESRVYDVIVRRKARQGLASSRDEINISSERSEYDFEAEDSLSDETIWSMEYKMQDMRRVRD